MTNPGDPISTLTSALDNYTAMQDAAKAAGEKLRADREAEQQAANLAQQGTGNAIPLGQ